MKSIDEIRSELYNLALSRNVREFERSYFLAALRGIEAGKPVKSELAEVEVALRPLALRENLTPEADAFYRELTGQEPLDSAPVKPDATDFPETTERAVFAGGCFWCMVEPFEERAGILSVTSGYTGGWLENPTYDEVSSHATGHVEAVEILFDSAVVSYDELCELYFTLIDPTDADGQFYDRGNSYLTAIFVADEGQKLVAERIVKRLDASGLYDKPIVTEIRELTDFWPAEDYHQDWYKHNPDRYKAVHRVRLQYFKKLEKKAKKLKKGSIDLTASK